MVLASWEVSIEPDLAHPDSIIRLTSTVLRFRCPEISETAKKLSFVRSFETVGSHATTLSCLKQADSSRQYLYKALSTKDRDVPHKSIVTAAQKYNPFINQILLACKVQPENAKLDERLMFEWASGIEKKKKSFKSEAIMYELVMTIAVEAMGTAGIACDECTDGNFASASREFKKAAGIMDFLATDQLPKWIARGSSVQDKNMPSEATVGTCEAFKMLFLANSQQMAVSTLLIKPGTPNYSLLAKLSLGIAEQFEMFVSTMRSKAGVQKEKIDPHFFTLIAFQIALQRALSMYFLARHTWDLKDHYGLAIAILSESISMIQTRRTSTSKGFPEIVPGSPLVSIANDISDMKSHFALLLRTWEKDNSSVYFDKVPLTVPEEKKLSVGVHMIKPDSYKLMDVEPVPLILPEGASPGKTAEKKSQEDEDRELALALQESLTSV